MRKDWALEAGILRKDWALEVEGKRLGTGWGLVIAWKHIEVGSTLDLHDNASLV